MWRTSLRYQLVLTSTTRISNLSHMRHTFAVCDAGVDLLNLDHRRLCKGASTQPSGMAPTLDQRLHLIGVSAVSQSVLCRTHSLATQHSLFYMHTTHHSRSVELGFHQYIHSECGLGWLFRSKGDDFTTCVHQRHPNPHWGKKSEHPHGLTWLDESLDFHPKTLTHVRRFMEPEPVSNSVSCVLAPPFTHSGELQHVEHLQVGEQHGGTTGHQGESKACTVLCTCRPGVCSW